MIDGVKIEVQSQSGTEWLGCDLLDFSTPVSVNTGEVQTGTLYAELKGLKFILTPNHRTNDGYYCTVRGSLHKFHNEGVHNADDFAHADLLDTLAVLQNTFCIPLQSTYLRNIEIGVNIKTPIPARAIVHNLVVCKGKPFEPLRIAGEMVGKKACFSQFTVKAYDKGKQYDIQEDNVLRLELSFKKMQPLKKYGIATLADLQDLEKVRPLGNLLALYWNDCIYFDKALNWRGLTDFERKKVLYYATPRNWADFSIKQRYRSKKHFAELMHKYNVLSTHSEIGNLIAEKWQELTAEKCPRFYQKSDEFCSRKMSTFLQLEYTVNTRTKSTEKNKKKISEKFKGKKKRFCKVCNTDISHKRMHSLYCSKKCNNSYHASQRKLTRQMKKKRETEQLGELLKALPKTNCKLLVTYEKDGISYTDQLEQKEIHTTGDWIRRIKWVTVKVKSTESILLTSYRARRLIKEIDKLNN